MSQMQYLKQGDLFEGTFRRKSSRSNLTVL